MRRNRFMTFFTGVLMRFHVVFILISQEVEAKAVKRAAVEPHLLTRATQTPEKASRAIPQRLNHPIICKHLEKERERKRIVQIPTRRNLKEE